MAITDALGSYGGSQRRRRRHQRPLAPKAGKGGGGRRRRRGGGNPLRGYSPVAPGLGPARARRYFNQQAQKEVGRFVNPRQKAITGYTGFLTGELGKIPGLVGQAYGQAQQGQAALDAALAARLQGGGSELADSLAAQLAAAGQSTHPANEVRQLALGAANAGYASGSAGLSQLLSQGASAQTYAGALPGIGALGGLQASRGLQAQGMAMVPEIVEKMRAQELEKWIARTGLGMERAGLREQRAGRRQQNRQYYAGLQADLRQEQRQASGDKAADLKELRGDVSDAFQDARSLARDMYERTKTTVKLGQKVESPNPVQYANALRRVKAELRGQLGHRVSNQQLNRLARQALKAAGYKTPRKANLEIGRGGL